MNREMFGDYEASPEAGLFSMDTSKPRVTSFELHEDHSVTRNEFYGPDETKEVLTEDDILPFGKFDFERSFDKEGNLIDWYITLYPMVNPSSLSYINEAISTQKDEESKAKLGRIYKTGMPITTISTDGIVMSMPGNSLHLERGRKYIQWSDGSQHEFQEDSDNEEIHYVANQGISLRAVNVPGKNGETEDLFIDGDIKYLSIGIDAILDKMGVIMNEGEVHQEKIRQLVNTNMSVSQQPSGGSLVSSIYGR